MLDIAIAEPQICEDPNPRVRFREFGESSLNVQLLGWIEKPESKGKVIDKLSIAIYKKFNQENIEIPFPQRTIHIVK